MTLKDLEREVRAAGYPGDERLYKRLSELVAIPEVAKQLAIEGEGQKRSIPEGLGELVAEFLARLDELPIRKPAIPRTLEIFLASKREPSGISGFSESLLPAVKPAVGELSSIAEKLESLIERLPQPEDRLLTEKEVRALVAGISPNKIPSVRIGRYKRWRHSDVMRWIAQL